MYIKMWKLVTELFDIAKGAEHIDVNRPKWCVLLPKLFARADGSYT